VSESDTPSPVVRRRRLGLELRRLREAASVGINDVAERLERSESTVSRIETGETVVHLRDVREMLDMYGVSDRQLRETLLAIAKQAQQRGWWEAYRVPADLEVYIGLEAEAGLIRAFELNVVHGLLQTEDYARAIFRGGWLTDSPEDVERYVTLRMRRQAVLKRQPEPLQMWLIQDEAALRRMIGGPSVLRAQLHWLIEASDLPNLTIQILPFTKGAYPGIGGPFSLVELSDPDLPTVVYVESSRRNLFLKTRRELQVYALVFDQLRAAALSPAESKSFMKAAAAETIHP
jgi:transcriptional regulator with XRE-family HTH domain